jgi:hypothetical protein
LPLGAPVVAEGAGKAFTEGEGFVGTALDKEVLSGLGLAQLNQPILGPVLLHPLDSRQGKHRIPALIQVRCDMNTRMATRPSLNKLEAFLCQVCQHTNTSAAQLIATSPRSRRVW